MSKILFFSILFLAFTSRIVVPPAQAGFEPVLYDQNISERATYLIHGFLKNNETGQEQRAFEIATIDLNDDGLNEYFVKSKDCEPLTQFCTFIILAEKSKTLVILAEINARKLYPSDQMSKGVRDLYAFQNTKNDFDYKIYSWEPQRSRYILLK